jgi:NADH-quinone oxidoreductase subunit G
VLNAKVTPPGTARADWMIAAELAQRLGADLGVQASQDELWAELTAHAPALAPVSAAALADPAHPDGVLVDLAGGAFTAPGPTAVPRTDAYSFRLVVDRVLYDGGGHLANAPSLVALARTGTLRVSPADAATLGIDDGTRLTVTSEHGSLSAPAAVDASVPRGSVGMHHAVAGLDAGTLVAAGDIVCDVRVEVG